MATIERIRQRSGLLIVVVFVALLAFLLGDLFKSGGSKFFGDPNIVGSVNGVELSRQEVSKKMEELRAGNPETYANTSSSAVGKLCLDQLHVRCYPRRRIRQLRI